MKGLQRSTAISRRAEQVYTPQVEKALQQIETDLGGRGELIGILSMAPLNPDLQYVLGLLGDPQHQSKSLAQICAIGNILPGDLLKHLSSAALLKGKVLASAEIGRGIQAVAKDVMQRAAPYEAACHTCLGVGKVTADPTPAIQNPSPQPCQVCNGTGRLLYTPDLERQKLAVELAQLVQKGGGINIAQINNGAGAQGEGGRTGLLEDLQKATDRILYSTGGGAPLPDDDDEAAEPIQEGEVLDGPTPE